MSGNADRDRSESRGDQLISCVVKKAAVEASLHSAQMLLLDAVALLDDTETGRLDPADRQRAYDLLEQQIRSYLMTSAWVLPPDDKLLASLSLAGAEEVTPSEGEAGGVTSTGGQAY